VRLVAYARASTEDQQITLDDQQEKLRGYAAVYDHTIVELVVGAESGKSIVKRPEFQRALELLRNGSADGLLVYKLDRLARNIADGQRLMDEFFGDKSKYGKHLCSVTDYIDTRTAAGRMMFNINMLFAQYERELIGERTSNALQHKIKKGERTGRIRFGYDLAEDEIMLVPNESEQQAIGLMVEWRQAGMSLRSIAEELSYMGIPTKDGKPWAHGTVRNILKRVASQQSAA
jgi:site-specific DNA recombinase